MGPCAAGRRWTEWTHLGDKLAGGEVVGDEDEHSARVEDEREHRRPLRPRPHQRRELRRDEVHIHQALQRRRALQRDAGEPASHAAVRPVRRHHVAARHHAPLPATALAPIHVLHCHAAAAVGGKRRDPRDLRAVRDPAAAADVRVGGGGGGLELGAEEAAKPRLRDMGDALRAQRRPARRPHRRHFRAQVEVAAETGSNRRSVREVVDDAEGAAGGGVRVEAGGVHEPPPLLQGRREAADRPGEPPPGRRSAQHLHRPRVDEVRLRVRGGPHFTLEEKNGDPEPPQQQPRRQPHGPGPHHAHWQRASPGRRAEPAQRRPRGHSPPDDGPGSGGRLELRSLTRP